jgi:surface carbohydrate biosynthesis protein
MHQNPRTLLLPVETVVRELDGKLLLALVARERGWTVYVGEESIFRERPTEVPPGVFLAKSARQGNARAFRRLSATGSAIAVLDEEALVRQTDDIYLMKHETNALRNVRLLMTWGEETRLLWVNSGKCDPLLVRSTGNPRVDMLRPELRGYHAKEIEDIRSRFGDYVLFNSNFATVNHFIAGESRFGFASWVTAEDKARHTSTLLDHKRALFENFLAVLPRVAEAIAPATLVIRPHPSEDQLPWKRIAAGHGNAAVVLEGSVVPWLAGARALVHNGCTTAVEAAVLGTRAISYRPVKSDSFDNPLPNGLSLECDSEESLLAALRDVLSNAPLPLDRKQEEMLGFHVAGLKGPLACEGIMEAIEAGALAGGAAAAGANNWLARIEAQVRGNVAGLRIRSRRRRAYHEHKFPELTLRDVNSRIDRFRAVLGRFEGAIARQAARNLFVID